MKVTFFLVGFCWKKWLELDLFFSGDCCDLLALLIKQMPYFGTFYIFWGAF